MELSCLDGLIGASETECECLTEWLGSDELSEIQTSGSGVYLDQLEGFNLDIVKEGNDCARGGTWDRILNSIKQSQKDFTAAMFQCIGQTYQQRIKPLSIQLGDPEYTDSHNYATGGFAGVKLMPMQIKGGTITIKKIGVVVNITGPVTVKIYSNEYGGTLIFQSTINAIANTLTWGVIATPEVLPMWSYNRAIRYYAVFDLDGTFQPKVTKKDCGCGGVQRPYLQWMDFEGVSGTDIADFKSDNARSTKSTNGILLDVDVKCKTSEAICSDENPIDVETNPDAMGIAYAIRFRAAARLYSELLSSTNISRQTMLDRDGLTKQVNEWNKGFTDWVNFLCGNVGMDHTGCWICRQNPTSLIKTHIKATSDQWLPLM